MAKPNIPPPKYALFVRIDPNLGRKVAQKALADRRSITTTVELIFEQYFSSDSLPKQGSK